MHAAVAATGSWIDPDGFSHVEWVDVQPATGRDADRVAAVCRRCDAGTGKRRDDKPWTRHDPRP